MPFRLGCLFFTQVKICNFLDIRLSLRRHKTSNDPTMKEFKIFVLLCVGTCLNSHAQTNQYRPFIEEKKEMYTVHRK